jgi:triosephosphate isomerase
MKFQTLFPFYTAVSVKPENANEIFKTLMLTGLIGGAALKADDFVAIINAL